MVRSNLNSEIRPLVQKYGISNIAKAVAMFLQKTENFENCILKVTKDEMHFAINGRTQFKFAAGASDELAVKENKARKTEKADIFLARIVPENVKIPSLTSFDVLFELQVSTNQPNSGNIEYDRLISSAARLEHGITSLKEVSTYATIVKQLLMYFMFNIIEEIRDGYSTNHSANCHKEICATLGYTNDDSKRRLRERLHKIQYLGELVKLFGRDILMIPRLGFRNYFLMNEECKNHIRRYANFPERKLGDRIFFEALQNIGKNF